MDLQCCNYCHLWSGFSVKFQSFMMFNVDMLGCMVTYQKRMKQSRLDDGICKFIHKKCPLKNLPQWHIVPYDTKCSI
jgi:hypothetical protein